MASDTARSHRSRHASFQCATRRLLYASPRRTSREGGHMLTKICPRCGKRLKLSAQCECYAKRYRDDKKDSDFDRFYQSKDWKAAKAAAKSRFHGVDVYMWHKTGILVPGHTTHHIEPIKDCWEKRLSKDNLIYVSESSHQEIHKLLLNPKTRNFVISECHKAVADYLAVFGMRQP